MSRCVVLGGGGFLGGNLVRALVDAGHQVRVFDRPGSYDAAMLERVEFVAGDFAHDSLAPVLEGCEVLFHLISTTLPKSSNDNPLYDLETNVAASLRLLEVARIEGVRKIVFVSSGGTVYGSPCRLPIDEMHPTEPLCAYGIGKLAVEKYLALYHRLHGLQYCILRLSNPYGRGQNPGRMQGAVTVFSYKALRGEPIEVWGDGTVVRDYIYVDDVISAFLQAMNYEGEQRVFNIGSGEGVSLNELLDIIEETCGRRLERRYLPERVFDVSANVLDVRSAALHLDWHPVVPLREGVARTIEWLRTILSPGL